MGHDVFISHSAKDKSVADAVCAALEANGIRCWIAPRDIVPGENWASSILKGISECRMMVLVFSAQTNSSQHIRREVERAVHHGIPIAPIRIEDALPSDDLEYFLSSSHWMDALTPPFERHLKELASKTQSLLEMMGRKPLSAPDIAVVPPRVLAQAMAAPTTAAPAAIAPPARRHTLVPVLLVMVLVIGVAGWVWRDDVARIYHKALIAWNPPAAPVVLVAPATHPAAPRREEAKLTAELSRDQAAGAQKQWEDFPSKVDSPPEAARAAAAVAHGTQLYTSAQYKEAKLAWDDASQQYANLLESAKRAEVARAKARVTMAAWEQFDSPPHASPPTQLAQAKSAMIKAGQQQATGDYAGAAALYQQAEQLYASAKVAAIAADEACRDQCLKLQGRVEALNQQLAGAQHEVDSRLQRVQAMNDQQEQSLLQQLKQLVSDHMRNSPEQAETAAQLKLAADNQRDKRYAEGVTALQAATDKLQQRVNWPALAETALREKVAAQEADPKLGPLASDMPLVKEQRAVSQQLLKEVDQSLAAGDIVKAAELCAKAKKAFEFVRERAKQGLLRLAHNKADGEHKQDALACLKELLALDPQNADAKSLQSHIESQLAAATAPSSNPPTPVVVAPKPPAPNPPPPPPKIVDALTVLDGLDPNAKNVTKRLSIPLKVSEAAAIAKIKDILAEKPINAQVKIDAAAHTIIAEETKSFQIKGEATFFAKIEYCIFIRPGNDQLCHVFYRVIVYQDRGPGGLKWDDSHPGIENSSAEAFKTAVEADVKP